MNPDATGRLDLDIGFLSNGASTFYDTGAGASQVTSSYRQLASTGGKASLVKALADPISLCLVGGLGTFSEHFYASGNSYFSSGSYERQDSATLTAVGLGARFYASAFFMGFDPWSGSNPNGTLGWPRLEATYFTRRLVVQEVNPGSPGTVNAMQKDATYVEQSRLLSAQVVLPILDRLSLDLDYQREIWRDFSLSGPHPTTGADGGILEGVGFGLVGFFSLAPMPAAQRQAYVPQVGFPGTLRFELSYDQTYDLKSGKPMGRSYKMDTFFAIGSGVGVGIAYQMDRSLSGLFDPPAGAGHIRDIPWSQSMTFHFSYSWLSLPDPHYRSEADLPKAVTKPEPSRPRPAGKQKSKAARSKLD